MRTRGSTKSVVAAVALAAFALTACASRVPDAMAGPVFVVVRHAEKAQDDPRDPSLSAAGQLRAAALGRHLAGAALVGAYATQYRRTQQTALPAATASGIAITRYDAAIPAAALATQLRGTHPRGTVLVVGHSNTVPGIVSALCTCEVAPLGEGDYDHLYEVRIDHQGGATLARHTYRTSP